MGYKAIYRYERDHDICWRKHLAGELFEQHPVVVTKERIPVVT